MRPPMMIATPAKPATRPSAARGGSRSRRKAQPISATRSGMVEAMIEATEAPIHCIATKLSPR